jgi:acid phosphatase (class A)
MVFVFMNKTFRLLSASFLMLCPILGSYAQFPQRISIANLYVQREDQPDRGVFLPAPPDTSSVAYIDDFVQWQWGKSVRPTERGERASQESASGTYEMARIFSEALGIKISRSETPAIYNLMSRSYHTAEQASKNPKEKYMRIRPVIQFNETPPDVQTSWRACAPADHIRRDIPPEEWPRLWCWPRWPPTARIPYCDADLSTVRAVS